jgi:hypothetical protein
MSDNPNPEKPDPWEALQSDQGVHETRQQQRLLKPFYETRRGPHLPQSFREWVLTGAVLFMVIGLLYGVVRQPQQNEQMMEKVLGVLGGPFALLQHLLAPVLCTETSPVQVSPLTAISVFGGGAIWFLIAIYAFRLFARSIAEAAAQRRLHIVVAVVLMLGLGVGGFACIILQTDNIQSLLNFLLACN